MIFPFFTNKSLPRYLLGELVGRKKDRIEIGYLSDDRLHEQLLLAEDELIDSYLDGRLSADRRIRFEQWFLDSPERREKLRLAQDIRKISQEAPPSGQTTRPLRGALSLALVAAGLLVVAGPLLWRWRVAPESVHSTNGPPKSPVAIPGHRPVLAFLLSPATRSLEDAGNTIRLSDKPVTIRLLFETFEPPKSGYRATIHPVDHGSDVAVDANISTTEHQIAIELPSEALPVGDYEIFFEERTSHGSWMHAGGAAFRIVLDKSN